MLKPGDTIGILGGGQLARMIAMAAAPLGLKAHVFAPKGDNPAFEVSGHFTEANYDDFPALSAFSEAVSVITYEFENVPAETAAFLDSRKPVLPNPKALETTQDRLVEKTFIRSLGLSCPDFIAVNSLEDLKAAVSSLGTPSILKTRRFGYDGKGQARIADQASISSAWDDIGHAPAILEAYVPFSREISVVAARSQSGDVKAFEPCENEHRHHILSRTLLPAAITPRTGLAAIEAAERIGAALAYVGVFAVEFFVVGSGDNETLLVNEIAPRVHNSGHWTIDGAETSQFEQHVRAIAGWPLGSTKRRGKIEMINLIGDDVENWPDLVAEPGLKLHLYGKREARLGRKMGHATRVTPEKDT